MDILSNFAESLSELIFENRITLDEFAQRVNIDASEVYRYKRKEYLPSTANIIKIADTFHCSIDGLLGLTENSESINYRTSKPFAECFAKLLETSGKTRYALCKETHLAPSRVDDWYKGVRIPTIDNLLILKKHFNCTIDYLFGRE